MAPRAPDVDEFGLDEFETKQMRPLLKVQRPDLYKHKYFIQNVLLFSFMEFHICIPLSL